MYSKPIQIRMSDLDPFSHVNNGAQCNLFDCGRSGYFEAVFKKRIDWNEMNFVLVHTEFDFRAPILFYDELVCESSVYELGTKSVKMVQRLKDSVSGVVKTECRSVLACIDRAKNIAVPVSDEYRRLFIEFEGEALCAVK
ncbi:MAG: acyl-CoA thioesterase [Bacteroidales bacterium]|nr:acyl-CoA thioesterase [Bacteroidales bacterium]